MLTWVCRGLGLNNADYEAKALDIHKVTTVLLYKKNNVIRKTLITCDCIVLLRLYDSLNA